MRRSEMLKIREVLRLNHVVKLSLREIASACNCGKSTVSEILDRAKKACITWPVQLNDKQLMSLLYPPRKRTDCSPEPDMDYVFREMKKPHVTLMKLWEEYKDRHHDGIMYTQFCERYRVFKKSNSITMHKEHKAGEEVEVDWAGSSIQYYDSHMQEYLEASIFVAVLPASNYPFCYAFENKKEQHWIEGHVRAYEYFHGVPRITIPDNAKTAVTKTDLFDPVINRAYLEMAKHYGTTVIAARPYKPRDKGADENAVQNVSRRIIASLRNIQFFGIKDVNDAIRIELEKLAERPFQKMPGNRRSAYEEIDKPYLQPLPKYPYEYAVWKEARVQFNYHVEYERKFYSVSHVYVNQSAWLRITGRMIEIFIDNECIAVHKRNYEKYRHYSTLPEHMPENHRAVSGWSNERFLNWAATYGRHTRQLIQNVLDRYEYPVQAYKTCMGIMSNIKGNEPAAVEEASIEANERSITSCKYFSILLKQKLSGKEPAPEKVIAHSNIRGNQAFIGGGGSDA